MYKTEEEVSHRIQQLENEIDCLKQIRRKMGWRGDPFAQLPLAEGIKLCVIRNFLRLNTDVIPEGYTITIGDIAEEIYEREMLANYRNFGVSKHAKLKKAISNYCEG